MRDTVVYTIEISIVITLDKVKKTRAEAQDKPFAVRPKLKRLGSYGLEL
jgi:hypothetical protein